MQNLQFKHDAVPTGKSEVLTQNYFSLRYIKKNQDEIEKRDSDDDADGPPHPQHLCSMCQRLGKPCNERRQNRRFQTGSRYENELSQAMRRMNI